MTTDLYRNARIFTAAEPRWAEAMVVVDERIGYVGDEATARRIAGSDCRETDLGGQLVLPGFVDAHAHVLMTGNAAEQVDLWGANDLTEIQHRISQWLEHNPEAPRVHAQGWLHTAIAGGHPTRQQLDAVVADRPVYAQSYDLHSIWVNSAALSELGIDDTTVAPSAGEIARDPLTGEATGYIDETAMREIVWPLIESMATDELRDSYLATALRGYRESGVTAVTDMAVGEADLAAMVRAEKNGTLTTRIVGHWSTQRYADPADNLAQVERAVELAAQHSSHWLRVTGIKIVIDGTVDGCTATLGRPYADGSSAEPVWDIDALAPVVIAADAAGLQVAMHAIGDEAVRIAIGAVERAVEANGPGARRHRIEHLEVVEAADIARLAAIGITASMQPVHADPFLQDNWRAQLGDGRIERGYPWPEMVEAGATLAFGTDSPTSPYAPLPNMFVAATRRSAFDPSLPANIPHFALPLADAIEHATRDAAWSCRSEGLYGKLSAGLLADFIVLDRDIFDRPIDELLDARVLRTIVGGKDVTSGAPAG